jgi:hypothetical protein
MLSYAGIGSRDITKKEENQIIHLAAILSKKYIVYSGNATGSDIAFQRGSDGKCVIFLPWYNFNKNEYDPENSLAHYSVGNSIEGVESVKEFHPAGGRLSPTIIPLMARNYHQIFGYEEYPKVSFVVCCADPMKNGVKGGTGQAIRIANAKNIPWVNIREAGWDIKLKAIIKTLTP